MMLNQDASIKILDRHCAVCGTKLKVIVYPNKTYNGGHYFLKVELDNGKKVEYWECDSCFYDEN